MITKLFEIRDSMTLIPALATQLESLTVPERWLLGRAGYGLTAEEQSQYIMLTFIEGGAGHACTSPFDWDSGTRTMRIAHQFIIDNWNQLHTGDVVDVEFISGESTEMKLSDRLAG